MDMQVVHFLTALRTGVDDHPETTVRVRVAALFGRQPGSQRHHAAQQGRVL
jgi:hypothetical protein